MIKGRRRGKFSSATMRSRVVTQLRNAILTGNYAPGEKLSEGELAQQFKTSRVPIREALIQLKECGLVANHGRRGVCAPQLSPEEVQHINALRLILEAEAIRLARKNMTPKIEAQLKNTVRRMAKAAASPFSSHILDLEFHATIWAASGNPYLTNALMPLVLRSFAHKALGERAQAQAAAPQALSQMRSWRVARHADLLDLLTRRSDTSPEDAILSHIRADFVVPEYLADAVKPAKIRATLPQAAKR